MSLLLRLRLLRLARRVQPSSRFLGDLEARLFPRQDILTMHRLRALRFAVVPALFVLTLLGGTGAYAYSSDAVLPDHILYPLRKSMEGFEVQIAAVTPMKDRVRLRLLERQAREKRLLQEKKEKAKAKPKPAPSKAPAKKTSTTGSLSVS